jgi:hypothetical protein
MVRPDRCRQVIHLIVFSAAAPQCSTTDHLNESSYVGPGVLQCRASTWLNIEKRGGLSLYAGYQATI